MRRRLAALVVFSCALVVPGAEARPPSKPKAPPSPPPPGFAVEAARFEPLSASATLRVEWPGAKGQAAVPATKAAPGKPATSAAPPGSGEYRGAIEVRRSAGGVGVVNDVGLEDYL